MSETRFTRGPWIVDATANQHIDGAHWREIRAGDHGQVLAEVYHDLGDPDPGLTDEDAAANAHLIAAAPDLYEALVDFVENPAFQIAVGGNPNAVDAMLDRARAALAKARGEVA